MWGGRKGYYTSMPPTLAYPLSAFLMIALPLGLGIALERKFRLGWRLWWIGGAGFVLSQVGHIPFNIGLTVLFQRGILPAPPDSAKLVFNSTILGLSAGLWEELTRYAVFRWWVKDARSWRKGVWLGAGHGGIEAVLLGIIVFANFFYQMAIRNVDLSTMVPQNQLAIAKDAVAAYWSAPWYLILLGALERAMTLPIQICFSVLILQSFIRGQIGWLFLAVGWHAIIDSVVVFSASTRGVYIAEFLVAVACLISLTIIFVLRKPEPQPMEDSTVDAFQPEPPQVIDHNIIETPEKIDRTRFIE